MKVRTRFAPSPTGALHVGGIRTALFAWLVARQANGEFILRLEDTDKKRELPGAAQQIEESLKSLNLDYDEGPDIGGPFAPYRQSERLDTYKKEGQKLIELGRAYADPYSAEEVQSFREAAEKAKQPFLYRNHRPQNPPKWDGSKPLRFKSNPKAYKWHDEVLGDLNTGPEVIDDFVLIKSDGYPTYNFSHIVDDSQMQISHVIRGQEFLPSTPNYLNLYEALNIDRPILATMPHILGPDGNKKLSKRDGAKDVLEYIKEGYLPEALVSFIATLGWNDGTEQEVFTISELIDKFSLNRVHHSGARFDEKRLEWVNGHFIRQTPLDRLSQLSETYWPPEAKAAPDSYKRQVLALIQERLKYLSELPELSNFFFTDLPIDLKLIDDNKQLKGFSHEQLIHMLETSLSRLEASDFSVESLTQSLNSLLGELDQKPGVLFSLIRIATTWAPASPELAQSLNVLGKDKSLGRIRQSISALAK